MPSEGLKDQVGSPNMPFDFYEDCPMKGYVHVFRLMEPYEDTLVSARCSRPWCSRCEVLRVQAMRLKIHRYLIHNQPKAMWLWTRSVRNNISLRNAWNMLHDAAHNFSVQRRETDHYFHGVITCWIGTYEIKYKADTGFNIHQHFIIGANAERLDYAGINHHWDRAAGYRAHSDFSHIVKGIGGAVNYVSKYISKGFWGGLTSEEAFEYRQTLKGRNRIISMRGTIPPALSKGYCFCCQGPFRECNKGLWLQEWESFA